MPHSVSRIALFFALIAVTVSCSSGKRSSRPASGPQPSVRTQSTVVANSPAEDRRALGVPPGHIPSPGSCRVWFPGRPPGQQPRAGECRTIMSNAPAGAWVLYRPQNDPKVVHRRVIDSKRPGVVASISVFEVNKGTYVRDERAGAPDARTGQGSTAQGSSSSSKAQTDTNQRSNSRGRGSGRSEEAGKSQGNDKENEQEKGQEQKGRTP